MTFSGLTFLPRTINKVPQIFKLSSESITYANYAHAIAGIIVIGMVVTILNVLITRLQKKLIRWH